MEILGFVEIHGLVVGIGVFILTVCIYTWYKQTLFRRLGIPQKPTIFFLGDVLEFSKKGLGYIDSQMVKENGKVFGLYMGNTPSLVISDTEVIKQILVKNFSKFTDRTDTIPVGKRWDSSITRASGDHWRFLRSTLSQTFTSGKLREIVPYLHKCMTTLHDLLDEKIETHPDGFDITSNLASYTLDIICNSGFGIDIDAQRDPNHPFIKHCKEFVEFKVTKNPVLIMQIFFPDLAPILKRVFHINVITDETFDFFMKTLEKAFQDRRQEHSKHRDLLQLLVNAHRDSDGLAIKDTDLKETSFEGMKKRGLTDAEVIVTSLVFMIAAYDTTSTGLSWIIYDLVTNIECQEKLIEEIDAEIGSSKTTYDNVFKLRYLDMVVNETLRMHPPAQRLNRKASEDIEIKGVKIKKGMDCAMSIAALHHMPEYWENPNKYDPERFAPENQANIDPYAFMPFGQGPRNCMAQRLALLELKATTVTLLQRYRFYKTDKLKIPMPTTTSIVVRPADPIFVRLEKRVKTTACY